MKISKERYRALCESVVGHGEGRMKEVAGFKEDDYLAGAMAVMEFLELPFPVWPLVIMTGRKVIMTDIEKVQACQAKDLPLLVGKLKDSRAVELLESRLKGA